MWILATYSTYSVSASAIGMFTPINKFIINIEMEFLACLWHPYVNPIRERQHKWLSKKILWSAFVQRHSEPPCSSLCHFICKVAKWKIFLERKKKRQDEKSFRFLFIFSNAKNADCRLQRAYFTVLTIRASCQTCKYKSFDHQERGGEKLFAIYFPLNGSFSYRSPSGISMRSVRIVRSRSRSVVNSFFLQIFNRDSASLPSLRLFHLLQQPFVKGRRNKVSFTRKFWCPTIIIKSILNVLWHARNVKANAARKANEKDKCWVVIFFLALLHAQNAHIITKRDWMWLPRLTRIFVTTFSENMRRNDLEKKVYVFHPDN